MTADISFRFVLRPVDEVGLGGSADGPKRLHWFGLTDGWYWIDIGHHELLRLHESVDRLDDPKLPYVDYYVVRLWEDLLDVLPVVLDPVPLDLFALLADRDKTSVLEAKMPDAELDDWLAATGWITDRGIG